MLFFLLHTKFLPSKFGIYFIFQVKKVEKFIKFGIQCEIQYGTSSVMLEDKFLVTRGAKAATGDEL